MTGPVKVRQHLKTLGYKCRDWARLFTGKMEEGWGCEAFLCNDECDGERWFCYADRKVDEKKETVAVTAASYTGGWVVEVLGSSEVFQVKDRNAR